MRLPGVFPDSAEVVTFYFKCLDIPKSAEQGAINVALPLRHRSREMKHKVGKHSEGRLNQCSSDTREGESEERVLQDGTVIVLSPHILEVNLAVVRNTCTLIQGRIVFRSERQSSKISVGA